MRFVLLIGAALACAENSVWGQEPPPEGADALIEQLGADQYALRQQAADALRKLGSAARPWLEAAATSDDPEIRLRACGLLQNLLEDELWDGSRVSISVKEQPVSQVFGELAQLTGNLLVMDESQSDFHEVPVSVTATSAPFWEIVDDVCRQSGNRVCPHYGRPKALAVVRGGPGARPAGYAGPLRVHLENARRTFTEELEYEEARSTIHHAFEINLGLMWESRFCLVACRSTPLVAEALTDTGVSVRAIHPVPGSWTMTGGRDGQSVKLKFQPPPASARLVKTLHLRWELIAIGDMAALDIADFSGATYYQDDVELELSGVEKTPDGRHYVVTVTVNRDLVLPEPDEIVLVEHELELFDGAGKPFDQKSRINTLTDRGVVTKVTYTGMTDDGSQPTRLRFTYPRLRSQRKLDFLLRDIPLPHAVPE